MKGSISTDDQANYTPGISRRGASGTTFDVPGGVVSATKLSGASFCE